MDAAQAIGKSRDVADRLKAIAGEIRQISLGLAAAMRELPDNPAIKRISDSPRAFTVPNSELEKRGTWSPFSIDFKSQYERIAEFVERVGTQPRLARSQLRRILENRREVPRSDRPVVHYVYAEEVVAAARPLIEAALMIANELTPESAVEAGVTQGEPVGARRRHP